MSEHSIIAPSAASIWGSPAGCRGYPLMAQIYPGEDTLEAKEGTAVHNLAARMLERAQHADTIGPDVIGTIDPETGLPYDDDMYDAAEMYAADVRRVMQSTGVYAAPALGIEAQVSAARTIHELSTGSVDSYLYHAAGGALYIWDLKYGRGVVEVFENWQLINYAAGVLEALGVDGIADQHLRVHLRIVQPRAFHRDGAIREWRVMASDLRPYFNQLHNAAAEALAPDAVTRTGSHCRYCPAIGHCEAAIRAGVSLYEAAAAPYPLELSPAALATQYTIVKRAAAHLKPLLEALEAQLIAAIRSGADIPGYAAAPKYGREKWTVTPDQIAGIAEMLGVNVRKNSVLTPRQSRDAGLPAEIVDAYAERQQSGWEIVTDNGARARQIFTSER